MGRDATPRILSYDEAIFAYVPWHGYLSVDRGAANALQNWDERFAELDRISAATDLATASAHTRFGPIDVFVLRREGQALVWRSMQGATVRFRHSQFNAGCFAVVTLPDDYVVAIRRPSPSLIRRSPRAGDAIGQVGNVVKTGCVDFK